MSSISASMTVTRWPSPSPAISSPTMRRRTLGRPGVSFVPAPYPTPSGRRVGSGPYPVACAVTRRAPVGVSSSPRPLPYTGTPDTSCKVAGGGTGYTPCAIFTVPEPTLRGEARKRSTSSQPRPITEPTTSTIESTAPTSWKVTSSTSMPWTPASTSPNRRNRTDDRSFTPASRPLVSIMRRISRSPRWGCVPGRLAVLAFRFADLVLDDHVDLGGLYPRPRDLGGRDPISGEGQLGQLRA